MKTTSQYKQLKEAMNLIRELKIPEHLQEKALAHLLQGSSVKSQNPAADSDVDPSTHSGAATGQALRKFISEHNPKGAVSEIPALLYWAKKHEKTASANERDIVVLYRRANLRPPKNVGQSMRDLASKKYDRLKAVEGKAGYVELSRTGEDFVLYDLKPTK